LPTPHPDYVQHAHRGGASVVQPPDYDEMMRLEDIQLQQQSKEEVVSGDVDKPGTLQKLPSFKVIWKLWQK
jgi:hypothetical protein